LLVVLGAASISLAACGSSASELRSVGDERPSWGSYPADTSLDERGAVEAYVDALDTRDGARFCSVVAPWISGRFDIYGTDPDASLSRPIRCPRFVSGFIGYIEDCCPPKFVGVEISRVGELRRQGEVVGVPITAKLRLDQDGKPLTQSIDDVVWVTKDSGAWRVAKLSEVAAAASIGLESEESLTTPPNVEAERRAYAAEVAKARKLRLERRRSYHEVGTTAKCPGSSVRYRDAARDVVDYLHPAPKTPTPQLPAADIRALQIRSVPGRICVLFELAGRPHGGSTFTFLFETPGVVDGRPGFGREFEVELRADGRARVTSGRDDDDHTISVPSRVGVEGNRLMLVVDRKSFASGRSVPASTSAKPPYARFDFLAGVTVVVSEKREVHDDVPSDVVRARASYP
jgi:hypothetical protein